MLMKLDSIVVTPKKLPQKRHKIHKTPFYVAHVFHADFFFAQIQLSLNKLSFSISII